MRIKRTVVLTQEAILIPRGFWTKEHVPIEFEDITHVELVQDRDGESLVILGGRFEVRDRCIDAPHP